MAANKGGGRVVIEVELDVKDAERELARLKERIAKLESDLFERTSQQNGIAVKLDEAREEYQRLCRELEQFGQLTEEQLADDPLIRALSDQVREMDGYIQTMESDLAKAELSVDRTNTNLEAAVETYGKVAREAEALRASGSAAAEELAQGMELSSLRAADLSRELEVLKARQKELSAQGIGLGYREYDDNTARIAQINQELKAYQNGLEDTRSASELASEKLESILSGLSKAMKGSNSAIARSLGGALADAAPQMAQAMSQCQELKDTADGYFAQLVDDSRALLEALSRTGGVLRQMGKSAVKAFSLAAMGAVELLDRVNVFPKLFSSLGKSLVKLGQALRRVFVSTVITMGLRMVRSEVASYLNLNAQFMTALRQLRGVLLTAFQPVYDAVMPALTTLLNLLARAVAAVTQFTAVLFGTTAKQAQKNAQALYEQSKATEAAGKAAEKAALQLANFDEINKLDGGKSGSGGGGADTGPLFDWAYEDTPFPDWGEALDAFLDKLLAGIPKLKDAFQDFADWFNGLTKKIYDMFTFPGVLDKVRLLGRELAGALNDLVNWIDWRQLGQALGAGLNLALNFLTSFLYAFDWMNLGRKLAELVNGLVREVDWYEFGRLLWSGFKIGLETLAGFLLGLDMPQLAQAASNIVLGFFNEMRNTLTRIPWYSIGRQIADFLANLDWYGMFSAVTSAIAQALTSAVLAVRGFLDRIAPELERIAGDIVRALSEFFQDGVNWSLMAQTIGQGITAALRFVSGLLDPELFYQIGQAIGDFFINLQWVEIFGGLTEALARGINAAIAALKGFLDSASPEQLLEIANGIAQKINEFVAQVDWAQLGKVLHDGVAAALDFLIQLLDQLDWESIGQAVVDFLSNLRWGELLQRWSQVVGQAVGGALKAIDLSDALALGSDLVGGMIQGMLDRFNAEGGILGWIQRHIFEPFVNGFKELFQIGSPSRVMAEQGGFLIAGLLQGITEAWSSIPEFFSEKLEALKQALVQAWEAIKTSAAEQWSTIRESLGQAWELIHQSAQKKFQLVKEAVSQAWTAAQEEAARKWEEIQTTLAGAWDAVKASAQEKFAAVKQAVIDKMGELKDHDWTSIGSTIMNGIWDGLKNIWSSITSWASGAAKSLSDVFNGAKSAISGITSGFSGGGAGAGRMAVQAMPDAGAYRIPALAQGAVIPPNREFLAVLGDQTHGTNIETPLPTMLQAFKQALSEGGYGGNRPVTVVLELDRREFGRAVYQANSEESQRVGVRLAEVRG